MTVVAHPSRRGRAVRTLHLEHGLLVLVTLGLVAFGLVMVYSATSARAAVSADDPAFYLKRQGLYALVGLALFALLARADYRRLRHLAGPLLVGSLVLLVAVLLVGEAVNGAQRWLALGSVTFQPSELAKLAVVVWIAALLARRDPPRSLRELVQPIGLVTALTIVLVLLEPDLGTAISLLLVVGAVLLVSGTPFRVIGAAAAATVFLVMAASWLEPYRRERLLTFLDPWSDPGGAGFQSVQAMIALGSGGVFGVGLGESVQKVYYLPEASTDMIFAIIGEELGLLGTSSVVAAYVLFGYAGFSIALRAADPFAKRLAIGVTTLVLGQAGLNLGAVLGLAPLTGIPLPMVSYGGTSLVVSLASVGILLNIAMNRAAVSESSMPDRRRRNSRARDAGPRDRRRAREARRGRELRRLA